MRLSVQRYEHHKSESTLLVWAGYWRLAVGGGGGQGGGDVVAGQVRLGRGAWRISAEGIHILSFVLSYSAVPV